MWEVGNFVESYVLFIENFVGPFIPLSDLNPSIGTFDVPFFLLNFYLKLLNIPVTN